VLGTSVHRSDLARAKYLFMALLPLMHLDELYGAVLCFGRVAASGFIFQG